MAGGVPLVARARRRVPVEVDVGRRVEANQSAAPVVVEPDQVMNARLGRAEVVQDRPIVRGREEP